MAIKHTFLYYDAFKKEAKYSECRFWCTVKLNNSVALNSVINKIPSLKKDFGDLSLKFSDDNNFLNNEQLLYLTALVDSLDVFLRKFIFDFLQRFPKSIPENFKLELKGSDVFLTKNKKQQDEVLWNQFYNSLCWTDWDQIINAIKKISKEHDYITISPKTLEYVNKSKKIRNLVVHNGGIVNDDFKKRYGDSKLLTSQKFQFKRGQFAQMITSIESFASTLNSASPTNRDLMMKQAMKDVLAKLSIGESIIINH